MKISGARLPDGTTADLFVEDGVFVDSGSSTTTGHGTASPPSAGCASSASSTRAGSASPG